jgi:hypothetical protein
MEETTGDRLYGPSRADRSMTVLFWPWDHDLHSLHGIVTMAICKPHLYTLGLGTTIRDMWGLGPWEQCSVCFPKGPANITVGSGLSLRATLLGECVGCCRTTSGSLRDMLAITGDCV